MTRRRSLSGPLAVLGWLIPAACVGSMAALAILVPRDLDPALFTSLVLWIGSFGFVGAFVAMRLPRNAVGWLLWLSSALATVSFCGSDYAGFSVEHAAGALPGTIAIGWLASWTFIPAIGLTLIYIPLLFPDGRLPSPRWFPVAVFGALGIAGASLVAFGPLLTNLDGIPNPAEIPQLAPLIAIVGFPPGTLMIAAMLVALSAPIARYRQGNEVERRQLRWVGFVLAIVFLRFAFGPDLVSFIALALLPIGIGVAILRFRLHEFDRIISRTVSYAALTAVLSILFVGGVVVIQAALEPVLPGNSLAVVASTLGVALLFQPLRRRIQSAMDRRFDRSRYNAERTIDTLAGRLRGRADLTDVSRDILMTAVDSVHPASISIWMRVGTARDRVDA